MFILMEDLNNQKRKGQKITGPSIWDEDKEGHEAQGGFSISESTDFNYNIFASV